MSFPEEPTTIETPYIPFPENPETIRIGKFDVLKYIPPAEMMKIIKALSDRVKLDDYETVIVNLQGGMFLFDWMSTIQGYRRRPQTIEYHRKEGGFGANIVKPIPEWVKGRRGLVLEDIYDSGGVLHAIMTDLSPSSMAVALITKRGIANQIPVPNLTIGVQTDNIWLGGCGMDLGIDGEENTFRHYPGIVVNPSSILTPIQ